MSNKLTTSGFIAKAKKVHGDKYDYSLTKFIGWKTKVIIGCKEHGVVEVNPHSFVRGSECRFCKGVAKLNTEEFIKRAKENHGDKYDYSLSVYKLAREKIKIICPTHGKFLQVANAHYKHGCNDCGVASATKKHTDSKEDFINKAIQIHGNRFDYSEVKYKNAQTKVTLFCEEHGAFSLTPNHHLNGDGCSKCGDKNKGQYRKLSQKEFIQRVKENFGDTYDLSKAVFKGTKDRVVIVCKKHGEFYPTPQTLFVGHGCPKCFNKSEGRIAEYLLKNNIIYREYRIKNKRYDFYLPEYNLLIERDGEQHYPKHKRFSSLIKRDFDEYYKEQVDNDKLKTKLAKDEGFNLARIPYWLSREEEQVEINNILNGNPTYSEIPSAEEEEENLKPKY